MARTKRGTPPSYRRHSSGQACVTVREPDGRRREILLGPWESPESKAEYARILTELAAHQGHMAPKQARSRAPADVTVNEVLLAFWGYAEQHYRGLDGNPTGELDNLRIALRPLKALYGHTPARNFDSACLEAIQAELIRDGGLCRTTINARVNRIRRVFRWAVRKRLVPVEVTQILDTVPGLQSGRTAAPESLGVLPVAVEHVEGALPYMPAPVAALVRLQMLTGCRAGEAVILRGCDLNTTGPVWVYRPHKHKNQHRGQQRVIYLGPQAQEVIKPFLKTDLLAYLFSPRGWVEELHARRARARKTKPTPSERKRQEKRGQGRGHAVRYNRRNYRQAVVRACDKANAKALEELAEELRKTGKTPEEVKQELEGKCLVPRWSPLQLRHTAATAIRARYGVEAAKAILGHSRVETTQIYAEMDLNKAQHIMGEIG